MAVQKLRVGRIPYANLFPIFRTLESEFDCCSYEFVEGAPSKLNRMLREGEIDLSPSSSVEYLRNPALYEIIPGHSVSSRGAVESILFFSDRKMEALDGTVVHASAQSETSTALLAVILRKFYGVKCDIAISDYPQITQERSYLLIGDDALRHRNMTGSQRLEGPGRGRTAYDLGEVWYRQTGLPFVFALWIVRKDHGKTSDRPPLRGDTREKLLRGFISDLDRAKHIALGKLSELVRGAPFRSFMSEDEILRYWDKLDYDLTTAHYEGLKLFNDFLVELSYLTRLPSITEPR
ncbi:MAG: menaquinone biosynthetic enzyme MqnA/MqnD family protein [Chloroflexota bacterium]